MICEYVIPKLGRENAGTYYCMARNGIRCTTMGVTIPFNPCAGNCIIWKINA
jgi:hypothetical protein